jgi:hypothetical protein
MTSKRGKVKEVEERVEEDLTLMQPALRTGESDQPPPSVALLEAYKKHVDELKGIEDRQNKIIALILGILSAAATLLIKKGTDDLELAPRIYISMVALVIVYIGQHAINELGDLRRAVRDLLVRCEIALRFYEVGAFLKGRMLYTSYERGYRTRGGWLKQSYWFVWLVCVGFIVLLWRKLPFHLCGHH